MLGLCLCYGLCFTQLPSCRTDQINSTQKLLACFFPSSSPIRRTLQTIRPQKQPEQFRRGTYLTKSFESHLVNKSIGKKKLAFEFLYRNYLRLQWEAPPYEFGLNSVKDHGSTADMTLQQWNSPEHFKTEQFKLGAKSV